MLPPIEAAGLRFLRGLAPALEQLGLSIDAATDLVADEVSQMLTLRGTVCIAPREDGKSWFLLTSE